MTTSASETRNSESPVEREFRAMCKRHDLTYVYSDANHVYQAGRKSLEAVQQAAAGLPREVAVRIWNEVVDEKLLPGTREAFYWRV